MGERSKLKVKSLAILLILLVAILSPFPMKASASSNATSNQIVGKLRPPEVTIIEESETGITLRADFFGFQRSQTEEDGLILDVLTIPSCGLGGEIGEPAALRYGTALEVPFDVEFVVSILDTTFEDFAGYLVYPVQMPAEDAVEFYPPPWPTPPFYINKTFYDTFDDFTPSRIVAYEAAGTLRDVRVLPLQFYAYQHNPVQKVLRFYWSIILRINYITGPDLMSQTSLKLPAKTSPYFEPLYSSLIGYKPLATQTGPELTESSDPGCDYLIITDPALKDAADRIAARRNAEGLSTTVVTTVDIPWAGMLLTPEDIKTYIQTAVSYTHLTLPTNREV